MQIVFTSGIRNLPSNPLPLPQLYRDHLEEAVLAEELGFDNVWASEHHFSPDQWNPSPFTFLAAVAARTSRIRLGTYVLLLPLRNPVQEPGPPIWVASMGPQSTRWTARRGYHMAAGAGPGHARYEELLREFGHDPATRQVASVPIRLHLAATREQAWDEAEAGLHQVLHFYRTHGNPEAGSRGSGLLGNLPPVGEFRDVPGIGHGGQPFAVGTPDAVMQALLPYRDRQLTHLSLNLHQPGQDSASVRRSMRLFARELMPALKAW